jgi:hypothetical protein
MEMVETGEDEDILFVLRCKDCHASCQLGLHQSGIHKRKRKRDREEGELTGENPSCEACSGDQLPQLIGEHDTRSKGVRIQTGQLKCNSSGSRQDRKEAEGR